MGCSRDARLDGDPWQGIVMDRLCVVEPGYLPAIGQPLQCIVEVGASGEKFEQHARDAVLVCVAVAVALGFVAGWLWGIGSHRVQS